jgi:hypothetical protein
MVDNRIHAIEALLERAESAHGDYERTELNGVYDEQWPAWYATYAVEHGLGEIIGRDLLATEVGDYLTRAWETFRTGDPKPSEPWSSWTARRIDADL